MTPGFARLWIGQGISFVGTEVTSIVVPLIAVEVFRAAPSEMALLRGLEFGTLVVAGIAVGVWVDRWPRRAILIAADLGRALLIGGISLAALVGALRIELLYLVVALCAVLSAASFNAIAAYLHTLVPEDQLADGISRLTATRALARIVGPSIAGGLLGAMRGAFVLLVDVASFLASALALASIRAPARAPAHAPDARPDAPAERAAGFSAGLHFLRRHPVLGRAAALAALFHVFTSILDTLYLLYLSRTLAISPPVIAWLLAFGSAGGVIGAVLAPRVGRRWGMERAIGLALLLAAAARFVVPLAGAWPAASLVVIAGFEWLSKLALGAFWASWYAWSVLQTPKHLQGRVGSLQYTSMVAAFAVGAGLAGWLGTAWGLTPALVLAAAGSLVMAIAVLAALRPPAAPGSLGALGAATPGGAP